MYGFLILTLFFYSLSANAQLFGSVTKKLIDEISANTEAEVTIADALVVDETFQVTGDAQFDAALLYLGTLSGAITTDAASTGSNVELATPTTEIIRLTNASLVSVDMIIAPTTAQKAIIVNHTGVEITINNATGATAANQILTGTGEDLTLADTASINVLYDTVEAKWLIVGGSGGGASTFQEVYDNSIQPQITLDGTINGLVIRDNATPIGVDLFSIESDLGSINHFSVDANGITLSTGASINEFSIDDTLAGDSDTAVPTEQAVKAYVDTRTPLTTKGDLLTFDTGFARLPVGADGEFIVADSAETTGLKWSNQLQGKLNPITNQIDYTPTLTGFGSATIDEATYSQIGDKLKIYVRFVCGTPTAVEAQVTLPSGYTAKGSGTDYFNVGSLRREGSNNTYSMFATNGDAFLNIGGATLTGAANGNTVCVASDIMTFEATIPVNELSSGLDAIVENRKWCEVIAVDNDADAITVNTEDIPFKTIQKDNCGFWDNSGNTGADTNDAFTPTRDMTVSITGGIYVSGTPAYTIQIYEDGVVVKSCGVAEGITTVGVFSCKVKMTSGSVYTLRTTVAFTLVSGSNNFHHIHILEQPSESTAITANLQREYYDTDEVVWGTWNGDRLYRRCFTVSSDITTTSTITTFDAGLTPVGAINHTGTAWSLSSRVSSGSGTSVAAIDYDSSTGVITGAIGGSWKIGSGTTFCMEYTK